MDFENDSMGIGYETTAAEKIRLRSQELLVTVPDTRGVQLNRWMNGNLKLGPNVWSYSRLPGRPKPHGGTCPGATPECLSICYSFRIGGVVRDIMARNSETSDVPALPAGVKIVRIHVSGDFDSIPYINSWIILVRQNPDVRFFAYTRSWRVPEFLSHLEILRAAPNVQLFASMDGSDERFPPRGWRRSWLSNDRRAGYSENLDSGSTARIVEDGYDEDGIEEYTFTYVCPEETKRKPNCEACGYCIFGKKGDVTFVVH